MFYHTATREIGVGLINPSRSKLWDCKSLYGIYVTHHLLFNIFLINVVVEYTDMFSVLNCTDEVTLVLFSMANVRIMQWHHVFVNVIKQT